tara:strand:+ start:634 stop:1128 length:495 start_codon:yes stop_codon:yes gene_type:complete
MVNKIGQGIDFHRLEVGFPLVVGGVSIPFPRGSKGHSDGDVLYHALVDALLGALSLGDIGQLFPSNDNRWKNANSKIFLQHILPMIEQNGYSINNIDATIILQEPHLSPYISKMKINLSKIINISRENISIKATTTDYMGFIGRGEGIAALSLVSLFKMHENNN